MPRRVFAVLIVAMISCGNCDALTFAPSSIDDDVAQSDAVVYVKVNKATLESVDGDVCGERYSANVLDSFKARSSDLAGTEINLGRFRGLIAGHEYLLFLKYVSDPQIIVEMLPPELRSKETPKRNLELVTCNGLIPGFNLDPALIWEIRDDEVSVLGLLPSPWPKSVLIYKESQGDGSSIISKEALFAYLRNLRHK